MRLRNTAPAVALALAAIAAGASSALSQSPSPQPQNSRLQAYLAATQNELAGTGHDVDSITQAMTISGLEIYLLQGAGAHCLLTAAATQEDGHSQQLACTRQATLKASAPLVTAVSPAGRPGTRIDLVALPPAATDIALSSSSHGASLTIGRGAVAVSHQDQSSSATLSWKVAGTEHEVALEPAPEPAGR